jgi:ubiquitin C-terminal hydrolase
MMRSFNFDEYARGGRVGLENNVGYTCYMNAALQCVLGVEELNKYFCGNHHVK